MRFDGQNAIWTGGSEGIGLPAAQRLAAEGASVVLVAHRSRLLREVAPRVGPRVSFVAVHVAEEQTA